MTEPAADTDDRGSPTERATEPAGDADGRGSPAEWATDLARPAADRDTSDDVQTPPDVAPPNQAAPPGDVVPTDGMAPPDGAQPDASAPPVEEESARRLHPLTPLVRGAKAFGVLTAILSYQTYRTANLGVLAGVAAIVIVSGFVVSWVSWRFTGYRLTDRELHVTEGVFARRHRTVPLERVQAVDVVRPVLARLLGLAEVRLEVAGKGDTEAPLAYLSAGEAEALRDRLLALVGRAPEPADETDDAEAVIFTVDRRQLLLSQLLTPNTFAIPFLALWPVAELSTEEPSLGAMFTAATGIIGVILVPVRRVLGEWGFTLTDDRHGLRTRRGLLDTRQQTVPTARIQAVRIRRPLLWRPFGWVRVEIDIAGYQERDGEQSSSGALVPVASAAQAHAVAHRVLPEIPAGGPEELALRPAPRRARWLAPFQGGRLAYAITPELLVTRYGWPAVRYDLARHARSQSTRLTQGPLQRRLGLASAHLDTAAGKTTPTVAHRPAAEALAIVEDLVARTRASSEAAGP